MGSDPIDFNWPQIDNHYGCNTTNFQLLGKLLNINESSCHLDYPINVWDSDFNNDPVLYTCPTFSQEEYEAMPPLPLLHQLPSCEFQVQLIMNSLFVSLTIVFLTLSHTILFLHQRTSRLNLILNLVLRWSTVFLMSTHMQDTSTAILQSTSTKQENWYNCS